jgi:ABC-type Mn2+/Zn2+ transport system permease subunit
MHRSSGRIENDAKHGLVREIAIARACSAVRVSASTAVRPWTNLTWVNNLTIVDCNQLINYIIVNQFYLFFIFFWYAMFQNVFMDPKILKINKLIN